jgi:uncharacterized membrane protein
MSDEQNSTGRTAAGIALAGGAIGLAAYGVYRQVRGQKDDEGHSPVASVEHGEGNKFVRVVTINRPAAELYGYWHDFANLPRFMTHLESVEVRGDGQSHWKAKAPLGQSVEWDATIVNDVPNELIAWQSTEGAQIPNAGSVRFTPAPADRGTEVKVTLSYEAPAGKVGVTIAKILGEEPSRQVADDLRRFKQLMEAGELPTNDRQPQGSSPFPTATGLLAEATSEPK